MPIFAPNSDLPEANAASMAADLREAFADFERRLPDLDDDAPGTIWSAAMDDRDEATSDAAGQPRRTRRGDGWVLPPDPNFDPQPSPLDPERVRAAIVAAKSARSGRAG